jgi:hypothetical protein
MAGLSTFSMSDTSGPLLVVLAPQSVNRYAGSSSRRLDKNQNSHLSTSLIWDSFEIDVHASLRTCI